MSIGNKMKLKPGGVYMIHVPADCLALFDDYTVIKKLPVGRLVNQAVLFANDKNILESSFPRLIAQLEDDAVLWIAYPKKSGKLKTDISRDNGWDKISAMGYDPVMQVAIDENWSALRFRKTELIGPKLRDVPMNQRKTEGIDYVTKTVTLPADAEKSLMQHKGLKELFYALSYSHKKEYVAAISDAKKEETRIRRIEKMVENLLKMQVANEQKNKKK